jgi:hypothetical protein
MTGFSTSTIMRVNSAIGQHAVPGTTQPLRIAAGTKPATGTGQHQHFDFVAVADAPKQLHQAGPHLPVHRIQAVGTVHGDDADTFINFEQHMLVRCHA